MGPAVITLIVMAGSTPKQSLLIFAAVASIAGAVGFFAGRATAPAEPASPVEPAAARSALPQQEGAVTDSSDGSSSGIRQQVPNVPAAPSMTLSQAFDLADPQSRQREMDNILATATLADVQSGLDWALSLPEGFAKLDALNRIVNRWGQLDGPAAAAYGEEVLAASGNADLLEQALRGWGRTDPVASIGYAQSMAVADNVRRDISRGLIRDWADIRPQEAADFASSNPIEVGRGGWADLVADRWSKQDPATAAAWAASLPAGKEQMRAYDEVVQNWCDLNIQSAAAFVSAQPPGPNKEVMVSALAREVGKLDQNSALQWASTLGDAVMQEDTAWSIVRRSVRSDPAVAVDLLQKSALSPAVQQALVTRISAAQNQAGTDPAR